MHKHKLGKLALALGLILISTTSVKAQESLEFFTNNIASGGAGCPPGTFQGIAFGNELSIIFNAFQAIAQPNRVASSSCNLRVPVKVPSGFTVQAITLVSTGFADIPQGGSGAIDTKIISGTATLGAKSSQFGAGYSATYQLTTNALAQTFNACGSPRTAIIGINTNLIARAINANSSTLVNLSTQDLRSEGKLQLIFRATPC